jgi:hypothetical protein
MLPKRNGPPVFSSAARGAFSHQIGVFYTHFCAGLRLRMAPHKTVQQGAVVNNTSKPASA